MKILVTGANGQLGNEMRILARETNDTYIRVWKPLCWTLRIWRLYADW